MRAAVLSGAAAAMGWTACTLVFPYEDSVAGPCVERCPCSAVEDCPSTCGLPSCRDGFCALEPHPAGEDPDVDCPGGVCDGTGRCAEGRVIAAHAFEGGPVTVGALRVLADGSAVVVGSFEGTLFDRTSAGATDGFVARVGADGSVAWVLALAGAGADALHAVAAEGDGVVVCGTFEGEASFGGASVEAGVGADMFVAAVDGAGTPRWQAAYTGSGDDVCRAIAVAADGGIYLAGDFGGALTVGDMSFDASGPSDLLVARVDAAAGAYVLAEAFGGFGDVTPHGLAATPAGGLLLVGTFQGELSLGGDPLATAGTHDVFFAGLDGAADPAWARAVGTASDGDEGWAIAATAGGSAAACGQLWQDGSPLEIDVPNQDLLGWLAVLESGGAVDWSVGYGETAVTRQAVLDCAVDPRGNVLGAGFFGGVVDFGFGPVPAAGAMPDPPEDAFVAKLSAGGVPLWTATWGGDEVDSAMAVAAAPSGEVVAAGVFRGSISVGAYTLATSSPDGALFVVRLSP
jgi:hypothetical protein